MKLHRCPGLSAWISVAQCDTNRGRGKKAHKVRRSAAVQFSGAVRSATEVDAFGVEQRFQCCRGCPGVKALRAGTKTIRVRDITPLRTIRHPDGETQRHVIGAGQTRARNEKYVAERLGV